MLDKNNLRENESLLAHNSMSWSIIEGKSRHQELQTATHIKKQRAMDACAQLTVWFTCSGGNGRHPPAVAVSKPSHLTGIVNLITRIIPEGMSGGSPPGDSRFHSVDTRD